MKRKHLFICESDFYENMRVHVLWIGTSRREQRTRDAIVQCASRNKGIYFSQWDCQACEFLRRLSEQIYDNLEPRLAFLKFNDNNVIQSSLHDVEDIVKSIPTNTQVKNPKSLSNEIKFFQRR